MDSSDKKEVAKSSPTSSPKPKTSTDKSNVKDKTKSPSPKTEKKSRTPTSSSKTTKIKATDTKTTTTTTSNTKAAKTSTRTKRPKPSTPSDSPPSSRTRSCDNSSSSSSAKRIKSSSSSTRSRATTKKGSTTLSGSKGKPSSTTSSSKSKGKKPATNASPSVTRDARLITVSDAVLKKLAPEDSNTGFDAAPETLLEGCKRITEWKSIPPSEGEDCPICLCSLDKDVVVLSNCNGHSFHQDCIAYCYDKSGPFLKCPICSYVYGTRVGNQPPGTMTVTHQTTSLPGYSGCGTIAINYNFPNGVQGPEHRLPGTSFTGTSRTGYLPDNAEGKEVLRLLDISFKRRLTFTIGTSVTSGATNTVIWNGIHHKTSTSGGPTSYGYPDPDYLARVKDELKAVGVE